MILIVIDGLTPSMFEAAVGDKRAPALTFLAEHGRYDRAVTTFPSLTPVRGTSRGTGTNHRPAKSPVGALSHARVATVRAGNEPSKIAEWLA